MYHARISDPGCFMRDDAMYAILKKTPVAELKLGDMISNGSLVKRGNFYTDGVERVISIRRTQDAVTVFLDGFNHKGPCKSIRRFGYDSEVKLKLDLLPRKTFPIHMVTCS